MGVALKIEVSNGITRAQKEYIDALKCGDKSRHTITHYEASFARFNSWLFSQGVETIDSITKHHGRAFSAELKESGLAARTRYGIIVDLKRWLKWLVMDEELSVNPFANVDLPKLPAPIPSTFELADFAKLLAQCNGKTLTDLRNRAMLFFLLDTGIRRDECLSLDIEDLNLSDDYAHVRHGKGDKARMLVMSPKATMALNKYLRIREKALAAMTPYNRDRAGKALWICDQGRLSYNGFGTVLRRLGEASGVSVKAHKFRATYATEALNSDSGSIEDVRRQLGHTDYQVLKKHYLNKQKANVTTARRMSPLSNGWG